MVVARRYLSVVNATATDSFAVGVWKRTIEPETGDMDPAEARVILRLKLSPADLDRADALSDKARLGTLTPAEDRELEDYLSVANALEFLKSKARLSLRRAGSTPSARED
jgi:hypothetical protein